MRQLLQRTVSTLEYVSSILLLAMGVMTFVNVIARYVFTRPIFGTGEATRILLLWLFFSALGLVAVRDRHIRVDLLDGFFRHFHPRKRHFCLDVISVVAMGVISWQILSYALRAATFSKTTNVLEIPYVYLLMPAFAFCLIAFLLHIVHMLKTES